MVIGEDCSMWPQAQEDVTNKFGNVDIIPSEGLHFFFIMLRLWLNVYKYLELFYLTFQAKFVIITILKY